MTPSLQASSLPTEHPVFDAALTGSATRLELTDGRWIALPVQRWHAPADRVDRWILERCTGPTVDLGCGPGRLVAGLLSRGVPALGVDHSRSAVRLSRARGAPVLHRDVFDRLPGERRWRHAVLADGNIGIGGDPVALLRRAAGLLGDRGSLLVETSRRRGGLWRGAARLHGHNDEPGPWFSWATVGFATLPWLAGRAGLRVVDVVHRRGRSAAVLAGADHG